jgi:hypothetical protein
VIWDQHESLYIARWVIWAQHECLYIARWVIWAQHECLYIARWVIWAQHECIIFTKKPRNSLIVNLYVMKWKELSWPWSYGSWMWVWIPLRRGALDATVCDNICQWLATGLWFSPGIVVSPNKKLTATI